MNIGRQWTDRLRIWAEQFPRHYFRASASMQLEYALTFDQLSLEEAGKLAFSPAPAGLRWGKKWEYGWFKTQIIIPQSLAGKRVVFTLGCAEEMLVWVNGREAGAIDKKHRFITLSRCAAAGERYEIIAEAYAGHGIRNEGAGPVAFGESSVPEPPEHQVCIASSCFGVWNEPLYQVAMDYLTLYSLVQKLPEKSLRTMKIVEGLKKFTYIADFELPEPELTDSVVEAGEVLKPLLACKNGSTAPDYTVFGQSHLDLAWLWPVEETLRKTARTYTNQLALMDEYEDYQFLLCEPPILETLQKLYPNVYQRVRDKIHTGAFIPEGVLWVESDMNIPSGESLIRQFVLGKRWFRKELGVDAKMAWMPDTFGFSAALPQIMKKCQVPYFATQKLIRQDPECEKFPYNVFWWEGMDGSRVLAHTFKKNNANFQSGDLITRWEEDRVQQENIDGLLFPFGFGDGGGGPTRDMVEMAKRCADLEGAPRCRMESPVRFFERQDNVENVFRGELYLAWHRGTLTSQAKTKKGIRKAEIGLKHLERALAERLLAGEEMPHGWRQRLDDLWKLLLFNEFHDIAPGTSIARVHQRAEAELNRVIEECQQWQQQLRRTDAPASMCRQETAPVAAVWPCAEGWVLENRSLRCVINSEGELLSVTRPGCAGEYMAGAGNRFLLFKDVNTCYDAWELGSMYEKMELSPASGGKITPMQDGTDAVLEMEKQLGHSTLRQRILLRGDAQYLEFDTQIDWQEKHKLLKVAFPVNAYANEAFHEMQFGYLKRPVHRSYQTDRDRYEVCNHRYTALSDGARGAAVLNDSKYGVNVVENEIRLTLLKSAMMPDQNADRGMQHFSYAFYPFDGPFQDSDVHLQAVRLNEPQENAQEVIFRSNRSNIVVETIKPADSCENALLVRAYEAMGKQTDCAFTIHEKIGKIMQTDMLEENPVPADPGNIHFGPFEVKTFMLYI